MTSNSMDQEWIPQWRLGRGFECNASWKEKHINHYSSQSGAINHMDTIRAHFRLLGSIV